MSTNNKSEKSAAYNLVPKMENPPKRPKLNSESKSESEHSKPNVPKMKDPPRPPKRTPTNNKTGN